MPSFDPADGLYYLRATSLLHHQAFAVSQEFEVGLVHFLLRVSRATGAAVHPCKVSVLFDTQHA